MFGICKLNYILLFRYEVELLNKFNLSILFYDECYAWTRTHIDKLVPRINEMKTYFYADIENGSYNFYLYNLSEVIVRFGCYPKQEDYYC